MRRILPLLYLLLFSLPLQAQREDQPELVPQTGHAMPVLALALRPDGQVASASLDGSVKLWSKEGRILASFPTHGGVQALSFAQQGKALILVSEVEAGREVTVWRVSDASRVASFLVPGQGKVAVEGDLLAAARGGEVTLYGLPGGKEAGRHRMFPPLSGQEPTIAALALDEAGRLAASSGKRVLWGKPGQGIELDLSSDVVDLALSPGGACLATRAGGRVEVWGAGGKPGKAVATESGKADGLSWVGADWLAWTPGYGKALVYWSPSSGETRAGGEPLRSVSSFAAAGELVAAASPWLADSYGSITVASPRGEHRALVAEGEALGSLLYDPERNLLLSMTLSNVLHVWDLGLGRLSHTVRLPDGITSHPTMTLQPGGALAALVGTRQLLVADLGSGETLWSVPIPPAAMGRTYSAACFHPDGRSLFLFTSQKVAQYDLQGALMGEWRTPVRSPLNAVPSPKSAEIAVSADDGAQILDLETGEYRRLPGGKALRTVYSARGDLAIRSMMGEVSLIADGAERPLTAEAFLWSVAFSPDGAWLALGQVNGKVRLVSVDGKGQEREFQAHQGTVTGVCFLQNRLATCGLDGTVRLWDLEEKERPGLTLVSFRNGRDWLVINPAGYFDGSEDGQRAVDWRVGDQWYRVDQFFTEFFHPGLLARYLVGKAPAASQARISGLAQPPEVKILTPQAGARVKGRTVKLELAVEDRGGGISDLRVFHNGHRLPLPADSTRSLEVDLVDGLNTLQATAFTADGAVESAGTKVRVFCLEPEQGASILYQVAVGVDSYPDGRALSYARKDATAVSRALQSDLYPNTVTRLLLDEQATRSSIVAALQEVAAVARPQDTLMLYLAGHGVMSEGDFVFLPVDGSFGSASGAPPQGLSWNELAGLLRQVPATHQLIVLDTCNSGAATTLSDAALEWIRASQTLARDSGCYLVAAAKAEQNAMESGKLGHGLLAYAILEAVGGETAAKAPVSEGVITAGGLVYYLSSQVPRLARLHGEGLKQDVVQFSTGVDFPVVKAREESVAP